MRTKNPPERITKSQVLRELRAMGTAQNRKIYARHGAPAEMFGVSAANITALKKRIKTDHGLALKLWDTGNMDARTLSTHIADPAHADRKLLDAWARDLDYHILTDYFVRFVVSDTPFAHEKMRRWIDSPREFVARAGWHVLAGLAPDDESLTTAELSAYVKRIERDIHGAKNRAKEGMLNALIAIGLRNAALQRRALAAAKRIGPVDIDHGETNCKTPDAAEYIVKTAAHRAKMAARRSARGRSANGRAKKSA